RIIERPGGELLLADEIERDVGNDVKDDEKLKHRGLQIIHRGIKQKIGADDDNRPAQQDDARLQRHAEPHGELGGIGSGRKELNRHTCVSGPYYIQKTGKVSLVNFLMRREKLSIKIFWLSRRTGSRS